MITYIIIIVVSKATVINVNIHICLGHILNVCPNARVNLPRNHEFVCFVCDRPFRDRQQRLYRKRQRVSQRVRVRFSVIMVRTDQIRVKMPSWSNDQFLQTLTFFSRNVISEPPKKPSWFQDSCLAKTSLQGTVFGPSLLKVDVTRQNTIYPYLYPV